MISAVPFFLSGFLSGFLALPASDSAAPTRPEERAEERPEDRAETRSETGREARPALAPVERFAIVIGNNVGDRPSLPTLHYADDDALAFASMLTEGGVRVWLLTQFDDETRAIHPNTEPFAPPNAFTLELAVHEVSRARRAAHLAGKKTEMFFVFSGHGDVEGGEGQIVLEGGRLSRTALADDVLAPVAADKNHVVVDACKSSFLAFSRGPGGSVVEASGPLWAERARLARRTGFVLSTSSDQNSHEWERFQGGVFSHELRSALRGGADADVDGVISYAELGAFLTAANAGITNPRLRPDFLVIPPHKKGSRDALGQTFLQWKSPPAVILDRELSVTHFYVEDSAGVRVADVHTAQGEHRQLHLPAGRPLFIRHADESLEYVIDSEQPTHLAALTPGASSIRSRGAQGIAFEALFAVPFSLMTVNGFIQDYRPPPPPPQPFFSWWMAPAAGLAVSGVATVGFGAWAVERRLFVERDLSQQEAIQRNADLSWAYLGTAASAAASLTSVVVLAVTLSASPSQEEEAP